MRGVYHFVEYVQDPLSCAFPASGPGAPPAYGNVTVLIAGLVLFCVG